LVNDPSRGIAIIQTARRALEELLGRQGFNPSRGIAIIQTKALRLKVRGE